MYHAKCSMAAAETYVKTYVIHFDILKALCSGLVIMKICPLPSPPPKL